MKVRRWEKVSKTIALREVLQTLLKTVTQNVSYETAPTNAYPYVVFNLDEVGKSDAKTQYQLEINAVGHGVDSSPIEALADTVQELLHKYHHIDQSIQFSIYQGIRHSVREEDPQIIRQRMLFELQLHELKGE